MKLYKWQKEYKLEIEKMDDFDLLGEIASNTGIDEMGTSRDFWMFDEAVKEMENRLRKYNEKELK